MEYKPPVLDYSPAAAKSGRALRRILYCTGLPMIGFGLGYGIDHLGDNIPLGCFMAVGCLLVAFALPV